MKPCARSPLKNFPPPVCAIKKLLSPLCSAAGHTHDGSARHSHTGKASAARGLSHSAGPHRRRNVPAEENYTPTRFRWKEVATSGDRCSALPRKPIDLRTALALAAQDRRQGRQYGQKFAAQGPRRVDQNEATTVQPGRIAGRGNRKFRPQNLADSQNRKS